MQKVHTINLGGIIFQIEEDAYELLKNYLSALRNHFQNQAEGSEIANDIEYRLGEMLNQKLTAGKGLIHKNDVEGIIAIMGQPTDFEEDEAPKSADTKENQPQNEASEKMKRKFYRDTDGRIIGGVCTGMAAYFGIDAWIFRVLLLASLYFGGAGFFVYIIFWIAVPKAKSTADRLAMKGEKPTLDNIVKSVEDRAKELNEGKFSGILKQIVGFFETIIRGILRFFGKITGFVLIVVSVIFLLILLAASQMSSTGGININDTTVGLNELLGIIYSDTNDIMFIKIIVLMMSIIPLLYLLLAGLKLIGSQLKVNKYFHYATLTIWFLALLSGGYFAIKTVYEFMAESGSTQTISISTNEGEILEIVPFESVKNIGNSTGKNAGNTNLKVSVDRSGFILSDSGLYISHVELEIEKSKTTEIELVYKASARGKNETEAIKNYKNIVYKFSKVDNHLLLDDFYKLNPGTQFRAQSVKIMLKLPEGQQIKLDPFIERLSLNLNDDDFDYDDDEIGGKTLMMTEAGLKCLDCEPKFSVKPSLSAPSSPVIDGNEEEEN